MVLDGEHGVQAGLLLISEQTRAGMEGAAGLVKRVVLPPAATVEVLVDAAAADIESISSETDDMERVHHCRRFRELFSGGGFEPGESVHRDDLDPIPPVLRALG